ncbi:DsbA family protein [Streptomyces sp. M2CJ-2]|uniref:2-hydroxychromene-2-carboxylate isomerase n=1 Tax=Streptomyces sp. M2CJ-2 TaxID=2803948 RepID=UPI001925E1AD|nr:DsbA family protein [Streptomyces sp. M2CJ-2]MBL3669471.1 DsbA family protein [Streptomyces sp. M2CJ-2]
MARRRPRWYFSFRSPYSWMAYRDLMADHRDVAEQIDWLPCWEPDDPTEKTLEQSGVRLPYVPMSREKHLYILQDVRRLSRDRGLTVVWPVDREPRWEVSHLAYLVAEELGHGREFIDLVYRARWEEGRDISDPATIAGIAESLGLDPARLAGACDDPEVRERGTEALNAVHRDGVFGVPLFIDGYEKFWGMERLEGFVASVRSRAERTSRT